MSRLLCLRSTLTESEGKCRYDGGCCFTLKRALHMSISTVGIIGAGTMGNGIAQACAVSGINVVMVDISDAAVQKGLATVSGSLDRLIKKEKIPQADKDTALARIKTSTSYDDHTSELQSQSNLVCRLLLAK